MDSIDLGRIGYEAYAKSTGGKTFDGREMPTWEQVCERTPHIAKAWEDAASAINLDWSTRRPAKFGFGEALALMKLGKSVCRVGWNGKGMFLFIIREWAYTDGVQDNFPNLGFIAMKTADNKVVPWLASQTDMLASDWMVLQP